VGNHERLCAALENLGGALTEQAQYTVAAEYVREGLHVAEQIGHAMWQTTLLAALGRIYHKQ
jgi:hypothetical protein